MNRSRIFLGIAIAVGLGAIASVLSSYNQRSCACKPQHKQQSNQINTALQLDKVSEKVDK